MTVEQDPTAVPGEHPDVETLAELGIEAPEDGYRILLAEDEEHTRAYVALVLESLGHTVLQACDGQEAVEMCAKEDVDIVLMDAIMPRLDGFEAARQIKASMGPDEFVPIVFFTSLSDQSSIQRLTDIGADGFLVKPDGMDLLPAKLQSLGRLRALFQKTLEQKYALQAFEAQTKAEYQFASAIVDKVLRSSALDHPLIRATLNPVETFNGDLLLATPHPAGGLTVMLGDFTGHGLRAAIGTIPVAGIFLAMAAKGFELHNIAEQLNARLRGLLPLGHFLACALVHISADGRVVHAWNGGLPPVLIRSATGEITHRVKSYSLPLGIFGAEKLKLEPVRIEVETDDRVYLFSDGVLECEDPNDTLFGQERLESVITSTENPDDVYDSILSALETHADGRTQTDDVTMLELRCDRAPVSADAHFRHRQGTSPIMSCESRFKLRAEDLNPTRIVPLVLAPLSEMRGLEVHRARIYAAVDALVEAARERTYKPRVQAACEGPVLTQIGKSSEQTESVRPLFELSMSVDAHHADGPLLTISAQCETCDLQGPRFSLCSRCITPSIPWRLERLRSLGEKVRVLERARGVEVTLHIGEAAASSAA